MVRQLFGSIVANIIAAAIGGIGVWLWRIFYERKKDSAFKFVRKLKVFHSGTQGYYYSFLLEENKKIWKGISTQFSYLGVSANTIIDDLIEYLNSDKGQKIEEYKFLLMNPENETLIGKQESFKLGYYESSLGIEEKKILAAEVQSTKGRIISNVNKIKNTIPYKNGRIQIRYFNEFLPWWMYVFDMNKIFVGLLEFRKSGRNCPLLILEKDVNHFNFYNGFENNWNRIWKNSTDV